MQDSSSPVSNTKQSFNLAKHKLPLMMGGGILAVIIVVVVVLMMNKKKKSDTPVAGCNPACTGNRVCNSDKQCECAPGFTGADCLPAIEFYSLPNYLGTKVVREITASAGVPQYFIADSTCGANSIGFKPKSVKVPTGYQYGVSGVFGNPGDAYCSTNSTLWLSKMQNGIDCYANTYQTGCWGTGDGGAHGNTSVRVSP